MMRPFTVDANAIARFQKERVTKSHSAGTAAIETIFARDCIALDVEKLCMQEWIDCAEGHFPLSLSDWIGDMLATGKVRYYKLAPNTCRKALQSIGLPQDDHKWVRLALGSSGNVIVTGDVDFFEPKLKKAKAETKQKVINKGHGSCSKSLKKDFRIDVVTVESIPEYLSV